jgi:hypothetical protein
MKNRLWLLIVVFVLSLFALTQVAMAGSLKSGAGATLVDTVRDATKSYKDVEAAKSAGYGLFHGCVSGPQEGAMGLHFVNGDLVGDGELDASHPEALLYEFKGGKFQLLGVEYVVIAEAWDANHDTPPTLMGQVFQFVGAPNRYRLPAFYELHVWAWKQNPSGTFSDWNPKVSCDDYAGEGMEATAGHGSGH